MDFGRGSIFLLIAIFSCAAPALCNTSPVQHQSCATQVLSNTSPVRHQPCATPALCDTSPVRLQPCATPALCDTSPVRHQSCATSACTDPQQAWVILDPQPAHALPQVLTWSPLLCESWYLFWCHSWVRLCVLFPSIVHQCLCLPTHVSFQRLICSHYLFITVLSRAETMAWRYSHSPQSYRA